MIKKGWSCTTLYAHDTKTTGNVGSCSQEIELFDSTAHKQLIFEYVIGIYNVWNNNNTFAIIVTTTVNNNTNSVTNWSLEVSQKAHINITVTTSNTLVETITSQGFNNIHHTCH